MTSLKERWARLDKRVRVLAGLGVPVGIYLFLLLTPFGRDKAPLGTVLQGVVFGIVYALGAFGLILIYRANRFINFAHGALGSFVGVLSIGMVLQHHVSYWIMLPVGVVSGVRVGALTEFLLIRRFQTSSRLILTVASIGLAQLYGVFELFGSQRINFISLVGPFKPPLNVSIHVGTQEFGGDHLLVLIVVPVVIAALGWFLLKTDAGIGVRASAENVERALLLGVPVRRLATIVWAIAGGLATLSFILTASFQGVKPGAVGQGPTVLLPLLATAVIARMDSLPAALAGGIGLGIVESVTRWNTPQARRLPRPRVPRGDHRRPAAAAGQALTSRDRGQLVVVTGGGGQAGPGRAAGVPRGAVRERAGVLTLVGLVARLPCRRAGRCRVRAWPPPPWSGRWSASRWSCSPAGAATSASASSASSASAVSSAPTW